MWGGQEAQATSGSKCVCILGKSACLSRAQRGEMPLLGKGQLWGASEGTAQNELRAPQDPGGCEFCRCAPEPGAKTTLRQGCRGPLCTTPLLLEAPQTCTSPSCQEGSGLGIVGGLGTVRPLGSAPVPPGSQAPEPAPSAGLLTRHIPSILGTQPHLRSRDLACGVADGGVIPHIQLSRASVQWGAGLEHWGRVGRLQADDPQGPR